MVSFIIILLVIAQLLSFYLIILLNTKIAKFKDLEIRQDKLLREMDDSIGAYLVEMREENDRLIKELSRVQHSEKMNEVPDKAELEKLELRNSNSLSSEKLPPGEFDFQSKNLLPKSLVKKAYQQQNNSVEISTTPKEETNDQNDVSTLTQFEQKVMKLHKEGKTIEQIAKITQKGITEIELLLKFHL